MKRKRIFYVINLDRQRILVLGGLFAALLLFAFGSGFRMGNARGDSTARAQLSPVSDQMPIATELDHDSDGMESDSNEFDADDSGAIERDSLADSSDSAHHSDGDRLDVRIADLGNDSDVLRPATSRFSNTTTPTVHNESNRTDVRGDRRTNQDSSNRSNNDTNRGVQSPPNQRSDENTNPRSPVLQMETNTTLRTEESAENRQTPAGNRESTPPTGSERILTLQMGAFSDQSSANRMAATLREQGFEPRVEKISGKWVVRLGRSQTRRGLWGLDARLREKNYRPILRQE